MRNGKILVVKCAKPYSTYSFDLESPFISGKVKSLKFAFTAVTYSEYCLCLVIFDVLSNHL